MRMAAATIWVIVLGCALEALAGCSKSPVPSKSGAPADVPAAARAAAHSPCQRHILRPDDVAGILVAPMAATEAVSGDAQSCAFLTAGFPALTVSVRPGLGRSTVEAWMSGKMPLKVSSLPGVGDAAVWQDTLHEVIAQKDGLLCDIQVRGGVGDIAVPIEALPAALGALCKKIFAGG